MDKKLSLSGLLADVPKTLRTPREPVRQLVSFLLLPLSFGNSLCLPGEKNLMMLKEQAGAWLSAETLPCITLPLL